MTTAPQLSLFYFASEGGDSPGPGKYRLLLESAQLADEGGLCALWMPERHFLRFGGLYGNPSVTAAAVAVLTKRIRVRAGSVVLPLQNAVRVAEEWAMIDNLSNGRVDLAIASGWHPNDFVLSPDTYATRDTDIAAKMAVVDRLWRGERVELQNGVGDLVAVRILPRPIQPTLRVWLTAHSDVGFGIAAEHGYNILTANFTQRHDAAAFARRITDYRRRMGELHGRSGTVTLMAHSYVGPDAERVALPALQSYLSMNREILADVPSNPQMSPRHQRMALRDERRRVTDAERGAHNIFRSPLSLIGTPEECARRRHDLAEIGVDEVACLIDFGVPHDQTMDSVRALTKLA